MIRQQRVNADDDKTPTCEPPGTSTAHTAHTHTVYKANRIRKLDDNIFVVHGTARVRSIARINRNMVVLRHNKRELTLINPIRLLPEDQDKLLQLGAIQRIIRLAPRHGVSHDNYYLQTFPNVRRWAPALSSDFDDKLKDKDVVPVPVHRLWTEDDDAILPGCHVFMFQETREPECAIVLLQDYVGNLLVTSNSLQAQRDNPYCNMPVRAKMAAAGLLELDIVIPNQWIRTMSHSQSPKHKKLLRADLERLLRLDFERLIAASGVMVFQCAKEKAVMAVEHAFPYWG
jgi:hypothetical protein